MEDNYLHHTIHRMGIAVWRAAYVEWAATPFFFAFQTVITEPLEHAFVEMFHG